MPVDTEVLIRLRAYQIWEAEGRPSGRDHEHWFQATREIVLEGTPAIAASRKKAPAVKAVEPAKKKAAPAVAPARKKK